MILYISSATAYPIYDRLVAEGSIKAGYTAQKFNNNLIRGLGKLTDIIALSNLPYDNVSADRIDEQIDGVDYIYTPRSETKMKMVSSTVFRKSFKILPPRCNQ